MSAAFPSQEMSSSPGARQRRLTVGTILPVILLCMLVLALYGWTTWNAHVRRLQEGELAASNLAQAAARQVDEVITTVDLALAAVVRRVQEEPDRDDVFADLADALAARAATLPQVADLFIFNETGGWVANSLRTMPKGVNNAGRDYFIHHRDHADLGPYIGPPIKSRVSGEWVMTVSRRISRADGSFAGVALATIPLSYLRDFHGQLDTGRDGIISIMRDNGMVLMRYPFVEEGVGLNMSGSALYRAYQDKPKSGVLRDAATIDGVDRIYAYRHSDRYPLVVLAGLSYQALFAQWTRDAFLQMAGVLALALLLAAAGLCLAAQLRRSRDLARRLEAGGRQLHDLADKLPLLVLRVDREHRVDFCNDACRSWLDIAPAQAQGRHMAEASAALYQQYLPMLEQALAGERVECDSAVTLHGQKHDLHTVCIPEREDDGTVHGALLLGVDVSALKSAERRLHAVVDNTAALIAYIDGDERFRYADGHGVAAPGVDASQMPGKTMTDVYGADLYALLAPHVRSALAGNRVLFEYSVEHGGERRTLQSSYLPERDASRRVTGFYSMTTDVTALKQAQQKLCRLERFDSLTGLPNCSHLRERLNEAMQRSQRSGRALGLLCIGIDNFRRVNDTLGHHGGDIVLREFAARLLHCARVTDMVARLAGDEFVILIEGLTQPAESGLVVDKIMAAMSTPFDVDGAAYAVSASIGVVTHHDETADPNVLLKEAGVALQMAKQAGHDALNVLTG